MREQLGAEAQTCAQMEAREKVEAGEAKACKVKAKHDEEAEKKRQQEIAKE